MFVKYLEARKQLRWVDSDNRLLYKYGPHYKALQEREYYQIYYGATEDIIGRVSPHNFRHTFATQLLNKGMDVHRVQEALGHKSISSTQIYTHVSVDDLRGQVKQLHIIGHR